MPEKTCSTASARGCPVEQGGRRIAGVVHSQCRQGGVLGRAHCGKADLEGLKLIDRIRRNGLQGKRCFARLDGRPQGFGLGKPLARLDALLGCMARSERCIETRQQIARLALVMLRALDLGDGSFDLARRRVAPGLCFIALNLCAAI